MSQKVCALLTGPKISQQKHGNGSSNMDSRTHTGKDIAAILKKRDPDLSSKFVQTPEWPFPSEDSFPSCRHVVWNSDKGWHEILTYPTGGKVIRFLPDPESGTCGETPIDTAKSSDQEKETLLPWSKIL